MIAEPVLTLAIEPRTKADEEMLVGVLSRLAREDAAFRARTDASTGKTFILGMSERHLASIIDRIRREFQVGVRISAMRVAYKESIRKPVREEAQFIRRSGGRRQFARCVLQIEPLAMSKGFEFVDAIERGRMPAEFVSSVEKGVRDALDAGPLAGFPIVDIKVTLIEAGAHDDDSSEMAFKIAGAMALRSGAKKADPFILEPIMDCEVVTPECYAGDVVGDLNGRRAKISEMGDRGTLKFIRCSVPLSEMFVYADALRRLAQGHASFTLEASHYEEVPPNVWRASNDPHSPDEPPTASAGRPVRPIRPNPGLSGGERKPFPPKPDA